LKDFISPLVLPPTVGFFVVGIWQNGSIGQLLLQLGVTVVFLACNGDYSHSGCFPLMYKSTGALNKSMLVFFGLPELLGRRKQQYSGGSFYRCLGGNCCWNRSLFARALGEFGATLMLAGNIPGQTQTIPVAIYFAVEGRYEASLSLGAGNLSYFSDGSHRRELLVGFPCSVAARGEEESRESRGRFNY